MIPEGLRHRNLQSVREGLRDERSPSSSMGALADCPGAPNPLRELVHHQLSPSASLDRQALSVLQPRHASADTQGSGVSLHSLTAPMTYSRERPTPRSSPARPPHRPHNPSCPPTALNHARKTTAVIPSTLRACPLEPRTSSIESEIGSVRSATYELRGHMIQHARQM